MSDGVTDTDVGVRVQGDPNLTEIAGLLTVGIFKHERARWLLMRFWGRLRFVLDDTLASTHPEARPPSPRTFRATIDMLQAVVFSPRQHGNMALQWRTYGAERPSQALERAQHPQMAGGDHYAHPTMSTTPPRARNPS